MGATDTILWTGGWGSATAMIRIVLPSGHSEELVEIAVKRLSAKPLFVCEGKLSEQPVHKQILKGMCCTKTSLIR